jgi:hypothetical protein
MAPGPDAVYLTAEGAIKLAGIYLLMLYEITGQQAALKVLDSDEIVILAIDLRVSFLPSGTGDGELQVGTLLYQLFDYG